MKREEKALIVLEEILKLFKQLEPDQIKWILEIQLPEYICCNCYDDFSDCECEGK